MLELQVVVTTLIGFLADPKTTAAAKALLNEAWLLGVELEQHFRRLGEGQSFDQQAALDAIHLQSRRRFTALTAKHMEDGVLTDEERLESIAAYDAMQAAVKALNIREG